jgi:hypothetical protein
MFERGPQVWHSWLPDFRAGWPEIAAFSNTFDGLAWCDGSGRQLSELAARTWYNWHDHRALPAEMRDIRSCIWLHVRQYEYVADDHIAEMTMLAYLQDLIEGLRLLVGIQTSQPDWLTLWEEEDKQDIDDDDDDWQEFGGSSNS